MVVGSLGLRFTPSLYTSVWKEHVEGIEFLPLQVAIWDLAIHRAAWWRKPIFTS